MMRFSFPAVLPFLLIAVSACAQQKTAEDLNAQEAQEFIQKQDPVVLDVRTEREFNQGHLADAKLIDFYNENFEQRLEELPQDEPYLVYCHSGGRSAKAVKMMKDLGFQEVYNLSGGVSSWSSEGKNLQEE